MAVKNTVLHSDADFFWCTWEAIEENGGTLDTGLPVSLPGAHYVHIGATGNFDTNFVVTIQGSNDGINWFACHDLAGNAATLSASVASRTIGAPPRFLRPAGTVVGAADASDVDVFLSASRRG